jgi:hypothetical protein
MNETATPPATDHIEHYLQPGMRIWFRSQHVNDKGKLVEKLYGVGGDLTYQGYTTIVNATYLVFDHVEGTGRKAQTRSFAVNAAHCPHIGPYRGQ